jgi:hypothetical protein
LSRRSAAYYTRQPNGTDSPAERALKDFSDKNFGIIIAYLLPGFVTLNGLSFVSPTVAQWLATPPHSPSVSGFLFVLIGSQWSSWRCL